MEYKVNISCLGTTNSNEFIWMEFSINQPIHWKKVKPMSLRPNQQYIGAKMRMRKTDSENIPYTMREYMVVWEQHNICNYEKMTNCDT